MSRRDMMRDPRYAGILLEIERKLHEADRLADARGLTLTDSNIRSLLVRAINDAKGKTAKSAEAAGSDKDRYLAEALLQLAAVRTVLSRNGPDPTAGSSAVRCRRQIGLPDLRRSKTPARCARAGSRVRGVTWSSCAAS